ncbi:MAG: methionine--tRNA ligase, partial [Euryarchaeota archaeon]|nr:methionine--tRNA ligase [Euryarchaeota archaeon]
INAEELEVTPSELVKKYHDHFDQTFKSLNIIFDKFGSTESQTNHNRTTEIVNALIDNGYVFAKEIELAYCPTCNRFLPDRYVEGICPECGAIARGDECDQGCGRHLEPGEILEPVCKICRSKAEYRVQEHFFFRLSEFKGFLSDYLDRLEGTSNARNYAKGWIDKELNDWCITRNLEWGVRFPGHDELVVYVWVDAPIGYISFTEEWANEHGLDWKEYWMNPDGDTDIIHFIGGDIIYHHCIFWPALLKGAGYTLPRAVVASGMVKIGDKTFSKSRGYVVWVNDDYLDKGFHPDLLRYYLASYTSHTKELNFSWKILREKVNNELVGTLGNFIYRTLLFAHKNFGAVPDGEIDPEVTRNIDDARNAMIGYFNEYEFKQGIDSAMNLASFGNVYFQSNEPWKLIKTDISGAGKVIRNCLQIAKALAVLFEPVMPVIAHNAWNQLGMVAELANTPYDEVITEIKVGQSLPKPAMLFAKIEDSKMLEMEQILEDRVRMAAKKKNISYEEFSELDIRVGTIVLAEPIRKSKKLLRLLVDLGENRDRQIVAGIAQTHNPDDLVGRQVVVLANMLPATLFGVESKGMILAADHDGVALLMPERKIPAGTAVR